MPNCLLQAHVATYIKINLKINLVPDDRGVKRLKVGLSRCPHVWHCLLTKICHEPNPNPRTPTMPRARACPITSKTLAGIIQGGLAPCQAIPSSGVYLYRVSNSRDTAKQSSRAGVYQVVIVTIMFFRAACLSNL